MLHFDVIFAYLDEATLARIMEDEMDLDTYEPVSKISPAERERIEGCRDPEVLKRWFDRAVTAARVGEVFGG